MVKYYSINLIRKNAHTGTGPFVDRYNWSLVEWIGMKLNKIAKLHNFFVVITFRNRSKGSCSGRGRNCVYLRWTDKLRIDNFGPWSSCAFKRALLISQSPEIARFYSLETITIESRFQNKQSNVGYCPQQKQKSTQNSNKLISRLRWMFVL